MQRNVCICTILDYIMIRIRNVRICMHYIELQYDTFTTLCLNSTILNFNTNEFGITINLILDIFCFSYVLFDLSTMRMVVSSCFLLACRCYDRCRLAFPWSLLHKLFRAWWRSHCCSCPCSLLVRWSHYCSLAHYYLLLLKFDYPCLLPWVNWLTDLNWKKKNCI